MMMPTSLISSQQIFTRGYLGLAAQVDVDPASNDAPLDFNPSPSGVGRGDRDDRREDDRWPQDCSPTRRGSRRSRFENDWDERTARVDCARSPDRNYIAACDLPGSSASLPSLGPHPLDGVQNQWGMVYPMVPMGADPNMIPVIPMGFNQYGFMGAADASMAPVQSLMSVASGGLVKEIIHCKSCTLFPPNPGSPISSTRDRPPGCRTVFVGGLPEIITEDIVHEIFDRCGEITIIRMSKKNFCHIRFSSDEHVDNAVFLSGYRVRIGSNTDPPNTGRLHVDYAQARDDLFEWECRQRQLQREQRHRERVELERQREPSPPPVIHYSEHEAASLAERMKGGDTFYKGMQTLITWLDRGDCSKRNSVQFYGMIQSTNSHVRRLMSEKSQLEEELQRAKERLHCEAHEILLQFNQIERVFFAASRQKVWDHFTKAQRKNIDMWRKQAEEIKKAQLEDALKSRVEDEMDFSDDENNSPSKKLKIDGETVSILRNQVSGLQEENDSLKCQLEAYKNEVDLIKLDSKQELDDKDNQLRAVSQTVQGMQQQLLQASQNKEKDEDTILTLKKNLEDQKTGWGDGHDAQASGLNVNNSDMPANIQTKINDNEAKLIGLLATFLNVHPFGASVDYIWSYLHRLNSNLRPCDVETLLLKFPNVFRLEFSGVGANLERKWSFTGFEVNS